MPSKEDILKEIKRTAEENNGIPLGRDRFIKETGITEWEINKYWPRFSLAQREAGFEPNVLKSAFEDEFVFEKYITLAREIGKIPGRGDFRFKRRNDPSFPNDGVFERFGKKYQLIQRILAYAEEKEFSDITELCRKELSLLKDGDLGNSSDTNIIGSVYLAKSGRYYKIGRTNDMGRRHHEITILLPENLELIHEIKTDDPSGIEAYWHRRFESKRKNGEWFDLNSSDVKAFKRWRRIV